MTSDNFLLEILVFKCVKINETFRISRFFFNITKSIYPLQSLFYYFRVKESSSWVIQLGQDPLLPPQQVVGGSFWAHKAQIFISLTLSKPLSYKVNTHFELGKCFFLRIYGSIIYVLGSVLVLEHKTWLRKVANFTGEINPDFLLHSVFEISYMICFFPRKLWKRKWVHTFSIKTFGGVKI